MTRPLRPAPPALALVAALALAACGGETASVPAGAVARVGDAVLTEADLAGALRDAPAGLDAVAARAQAVDRWVRRELLVQHARAQGLADDPAVRRQLEDAERATLEAAALDALFAQTPAEPTDVELRSYYQRNRAALALRDPYVRLRHLRVTDRQRAALARAALARALGSPYPDSLFALVAREFADDPAGAAALASEYVSEGRLRSLDQALGERVAGLAAGGEVAVVPAGPTFHVVQVVDRVPAGAVPPFDVVRGELVERLVIEHRRDGHARLLQRLRSEAQARGQLEL